jgi:hypothetical protein
MTRNFDACHRRGWGRDGVRVLSVPKRAYPSHEAACREAERLGQRAYKCPRCGFWHLTTRGEP